MALLHVPLPPAQTGGGEDIIFFSLIFPEHREFWTPLQIPICHPTLAAPCYKTSDPLLSGTTPNQLSPTGQGYMGHLQCPSFHNLIWFRVMQGLTSEISQLGISWEDGELKPVHMSLPETL